MKKIFIFFILLFSIFSFSVSATDKIDINTATLEQLDELTGIGPKYAKAIMDGRPFSSVDDLTRVKGIGEKTLQKIKDQGLACVDCQSTQISNFQLSISNENTNDTTKVQIAKETKTYPDGILINEILPSPEGSDETSEWVELYNSNNFDVDLSGWKIKDTSGTPTTYTFLENTKILATGFLVFKRPDTKITLNNDADGIVLLSPNGKNVDSVEYVKAPKNQSYNKTNSGWQWSTTITPGLANVITGTSIKVLSKITKSVNNNLEADLTGINTEANLNQEKSLSALINSKTNPWFLFLTALVTTIILASTVLFIKFRVYKK